MPKTIAITPSWYWPQGVPRVIGTPPYTLGELCIDRPAHRQPGEAALIAGNARLTAGQLKDAVDAASGSYGEGSVAAIRADGSADSVIAFFAALKAGAHVSLTAGGATAPPAGAEDIRRPVVTMDGTHGPVRHSHRSLLAAALSLTTFVEAGRGRPWFVSVPLSRWEGILSLVAPLLSLAPAVLAPQGKDPDETVATLARERAGFALDDLDTAFMWTREAKRASKDARRVLDAFLLTTPGMFDPDARRRVARSFESPALTVFGLPETGPIFGSHASWYLDESIGLPITNMHVVPADPRTGAPIQALWELVESAEVTVFSPALFAADESHAGRFAGNRYRTGVQASSDANGMIYLLG